MNPLVSVICISHNHAPYVRQALDSVIQQTYSPIELIIVDVGSADSSVAEIQDWILSYSGVPFLRLETNVGNCVAFNMALKAAKGKYVIDLSADDELMPQRVARGVTCMEEDDGIGVQFSDAELIGPTGNPIGFHSDRFPHDTIPQGKIFREVLSRYFINSPTTMFRKSLLDELGGYDESLAYEDFDFWIRSTPRTRYAYLPEALVRRRMLPSSMGKQQYKRTSNQALSTWVVCKKALKFCKSPEDFLALRKRVAYEMRQALRIGRFLLAWSYVRLWIEAR